MKAKWVKAARTFEPKTKVSQLKHRANLMFRDPILVRKTKEYLYQNQSKHITNMGVFCLSERCDSILMWSHYADCHKGVCIGFDTTYFKQPHIQKIRYNSEYPNLNYYKSSPEEMDIRWRFCFVPEFKRGLTPKGAVHVLGRCASLGLLLCGPEHHAGQNPSFNPPNQPTNKIHPIFRRKIIRLKNVVAFSSLDNLIISNQLI